MVFTPYMRADQLGTAFDEVLIEANSQTIGPVFSEATVAEATPSYVPFIVASTGRRNLRRGPAFAVRTRRPSTSTRHPMGHAGARGPSLAQCAGEGRCGIRIVDRLYWSLQ